MSTRRYRLLAVNALTAFLAAYGGWQWALIVCQNPKMWTLAALMYQARQWWSSTPWIASAAFVVISIPTWVVFLTCQRVILRGIIIPQRKWQGSRGERALQPALN